MLLRYLNILPLDLNKFVTGDVLGRKKRSTDPKVIQEKERLAETMFTVNINIVSSMKSFKSITK